MKFSVCGGLDVPDWILAHMSILSKISSVRMKALAKLIVDRMLEERFDYEKVFKLSKDSALGESEVRACVAVLHFFIANAAKFDIDDLTFSRELQQLGLPREHSDVLCSPYLDNKEALQRIFLEQTLRIPVLQLEGWQAQLSETKSVVMRLTKSEAETGENNKSESWQICVAAEKFHLLLQELKAARSMLEELT